MNLDPHALQEGLCLFAPSKCSGELRSVGLRANDDGTSRVSVCRAHFGRLRALAPRHVNALERVLREAFGPPDLADRNLG